MLLERPFLRRHADLAEPASGAVERLQNPARPGVGDEEQDASAVAEVPFDIRSEVAIDDVREALRPLEREIELLADETRGAIRRDERGAADDGRCAALAIDDLDGGVTVRVGAAAHQSRRFDREADVDQSARRARRPAGFPR